MAKASSRLPTRSSEAAKAPSEPSTPESMDTECEDSPPRFKKMKPRVGSQYQTKVPKTFDSASYESNRPAPRHMSSEHAHVALDELTNDAIESKNLAPCSTADSHRQATCTSTTNQSSLHNFLPVHAHNDNSDNIVKRGGTCVHRSSKGEDDSFLYRAHLLFSPSPESIILSSNEAFTQEMISMYGSTQNTRRKKRRLTDHTEQWTSCSSLKASPDYHDIDIEGEDQETMLKMLQLRYDGNVEAAELEMRVMLSHGVACKARRASLLKWQKDRFKRPSVQSSASWRHRLEHSTTMMGDLRVGLCDDNLERSTTDRSREVPDEDMKGVWRSILSYGQSMERTVSAADGAKPCFSEVMKFLFHCYALPIPESSFGNRHVCVEQLSECFNSLLDHVSKARDVLSEIMDCLAENQDGVDTEALRKLLDIQLDTCPLLLTEEAVLRKHLVVASKWQERLDGLLATAHDAEDQDNLLVAETLAEEARSYGVRMRGLVLLEKKIQKAHQLDERLSEWDRGSKANTVKAVSGLVREANRVNLPSSRVRKLWRFHKELEAWVDRANIAVRSRISLSEIESLIGRAEAMPLNLSEFVDKLQSRVRLARSWIQKLESYIPGICGDADVTVDKCVGLMMHIRNALADDQNKGGLHNCLIELSSEGVRIPVEVNCIKMLQIEIDAKNWTQKAERWVPGIGDSKKGKIEELRDHLVKADNLRDRLPYDEKNKWMLNHESALRAIVELADKWLEEFQPFLESENKKRGVRSCLSLEKLRHIVAEGTAIHANIGSSVTKLGRVLSQAEGWFENNESLLVRAGVLKVDGKFKVGSVSLSELTNAVSAASANISFELEEAAALQEVVSKIHTWVDRTGNAAPIKRSKRVGKGRWSCKPTRFRVQDLEELIEEARTLPIPTDEEVHRLEIQLDEVRAWRIKARSDLKEIATGFHNLRSAIESIHGSPEEFYNEGAKSSLIPDGNHCPATTMTTPSEPEVGNDTDMAIVSDSQDVGYGPQSERDACSEIASQTDASSTGSDSDLLGHNNVDRAISAMLEEARKTGVMTSEEDVVSDLEVVSKWCAKSLKVLVTPNGIYEKRTYQHFNALIEAGGELLESSEAKDQDIDQELSGLLRKSWSLVVQEQLHRLGKLRAHRDAFVEWSKTAQILMSAKEKKITFQSIEDLAEQSLKYPASADIVQRVQTLARRVSQWKETVNTQINAVEKKLTMVDAKVLCEEADKLKLSCHELKVLRNAMKSTRSWFNRAKKCKVDQGGTAANEVERLIDEHVDLLIVMPEEASKLKHALKGYCLCRRPYEGFMIGCDGCDEWYHGSCIGVSENQADRYDKYLCVRCCVKRVFKSSSCSVANTIRKWTSPKERKKARQADYQKHQRKVRKEKKDIEKFVTMIAEIRHRYKPIHEGTGSIGVVPFSGGDGGEAKEDTEPAAAPASIPINGITDSIVTTGAASEEGSHNSTTKSSENPVTQERVGSGDQVGEETNIQRSGCNDVELSSHENKSTPHTENDQPAPSDEREGALAKINELERAIGSCRARLETLSQKASERAATEQQEDLCAEQLKIWFIRVRSIVLVPSSQENADRAKPHPDGSLSAPMLDVFKDAETLGIAKFLDVHQVANSFKCIAWSCLAMSTLAQRSSLKEIQHVLGVCSALTLPEEKATRMLKAMVQRTNQWQQKVRKALMPRPGEAQPFNLDVLKSLEHGSSALPFEVPDTACLANAIDDKGCRHCICGGANDGSFMLGCDKCEKWFHGRCVGVNKEAGDGLEHWLCPPCCGTAVKLPKFDSFDCLDIEDDESRSSQEDAPCAPTVDKIWPPFQLLGSTESKEALGELCVSIPDSYGDFVVSDEPPLKQEALAMERSETLHAHVPIQPEAFSAGVGTTGAELPELTTKEPTAVEVGELPELTTKEPTAVEVGEITAKQPAIACCDTHNMVSQPYHVNNAAKTICVVPQVHVDDATNDHVATPASEGAVEVGEQGMPMDLTENRSHEVSMAVETMINEVQP